MSNVRALILTVAFLLTCSLGCFRQGGYWQHSQRRQYRIPPYPSSQIPMTPFSLNRGISPDGTYLGKLSANPYDPDSISNPYGVYGSRYSPTSVNNSYGQYGSRYSPNSANNPYASSSPSIQPERRR